MGYNKTILKTKKFNLFFEYQPEVKYYSILPCCIVFQKGSESLDYTDITFCWFKMAINIRIF